MPRYRERHWPRIVASYGILLVVMAVVGDFAYEAAALANRPIVIRLAAALLVAIVLIHTRTRFRGDPRWDAPSEFDNALVRETQAVKLDPALVKLRTELTNSVRSRSCFDNVLWPRLRALVEARGGDAALLDQALPPRTRPRWRGPSPRTLAALIDRIESGP
jgi:hypothetical protein